MGHIGQERSMEEILSSIKRVIAEGADPERAPRRGREPDILPDDDEDGDGSVLELTEPAEGEPFAQGLPEPVADVPPWEEDLLPEDQPAEPVEMGVRPAAPAVQPAPPQPEGGTRAPAADPAPRPAPASAGITPGLETPPLVSPAAAEAARQALASLGRMKVKADGSDGTVEGLVRDMLRPMLAEWLDTNLPPMVERLVAAEVARLAGNIGD